MRRLYIVCCILFVVCFQTQKSNAQDLLRVPGSWIDGMRLHTDDTLYIINFWATWCKPCVEELPIFEEIALKYKSQKLKVILVSNDMRKDVDIRLEAFAKKYKIKSEIIWMNEVNADAWINKVSKNWSGAIPATWILKNSIGFEYFKEGEVNKEELDILIDQTLNLQ